MKKILALAVLLAFPASALAVDNTLLITPCAAGCITTKSKDIGAGVQAPQPVLSDSSGNVLAMPTAGADAVSNTALGLQGYNYPFWFNGATWDRARGDATNGAFVNVKTSVLPTGAATAAKQPALGTAGTASTDVLTVQGIAAMTPFIVTNSGTFAVQAAQSGTWNVTNISGTVSLPTGAATAANQATEISSLATIATNTGAAVPAGTARIGYVSDDPCTQLTKTNFTFSTTSGTVQIVAPSGSTQVYICSLVAFADTAVKLNAVGGTGAACTTGTPVAALGSTTAANGMSVPATGGMTFGNGGATAFRTTTAGHGMCLIQSGTTLLAGGGTFVQQ